MDAREYLQQVQSLCNSFDPEALLRANDAPIDNALEALKKMRLELEIIELLKPALNAMLPDFTSFEPHTQYPNQAQELPALRFRDSG
ncbi:hypothetical protein TUN199_10742 [Pyrenophora tritici-repentis]|uniref:Uncharacterized protein n=1 Tax=Pyrenophora tritici-repentis TaxID=45151 RepID=A0A317AMU0_9PLEO|nr:hypothetical protein PtrV1_13758 [Pyrenophora tritici-repentis]KAF7447215.1 hypothetical protein A1F99_086620 [Pyrenophora tritici-repentis]KAI0617262.1 hypothetical protein TUN199_10742 [Pyrenophora tritici-repentis]KAI1510320.1 hypothetical protein Ptr86124_010766 [Pyrenophora tritici-repentis]KAI1680670.1 hypothetical protein KJE20_09521 [Pyrenophora tritici-repentis]